MLLEERVIVLASQGLGDLQPLRNLLYQVLSVAQIVDDRIDNLFLDLERAKWEGALKVLEAQHPLLGVGPGIRFYIDGFL